MQPSYISVMSIFMQQTRYTVPLFQRPYVWNRYDQWEPLWNDMRNAADRVLAANGQPVSSHFLGTVVLDQAPNTIATLPRREVIDGQQRLTTLQLALKAAEHALEALRGVVSDDETALKAVDLASRQIAPLTSNPAEEDEKYKVWPTNEDRAAFRDVMDATPATGADTQTKMGQAYAYFRGEFAAWLNRDRHGERAKALASALKDHLKLIVLDLDDHDEPQAIFETLNAHGTPLLPADLIKNWLLWEATRQSLATDKLYIAHWQPFDRDGTHWRAKIGVGHAARARVDTFLQNWLTRHVLEPISAKHLYDRFLHYVEAGGQRLEDGKLDVDAIMRDIADDAQRFRQIEEGEGSSRFAIFLQRLKVLDVVVFHPLLLEIMGRAGSDDVDRDLCAETLESYLVRRLVCGMQTRGYGTLALNLLKAVKALPADAPAAPALIEALTSTTEGADRWPDDTSFKFDWLGRQFYYNIKRARVLMMLRAIEEHYQREHIKGEPVLAFNFDALQIEHILPQTWETHWPLLEPTTREDRNRALHGIGNLTLVSAPLNKDLSNGPWHAPEGKASKRNGLGIHSKLDLNARLLREHPEQWDEGCIAARAQQLFDTAMHIWKAPSVMLAKVDVPAVQPLQALHNLQPAGQE